MKKCIENEISKNSKNFFKKIAIWNFIDQKEKSVDQNNLETDIDFDCDVAISHANIEIMKLKLDSHFDIERAIKKWLLIRQNQNREDLRIFLPKYETSIFCCI